MGRKRKTGEPWTAEELAKLPVTRAEARALGSRYYFRNKPCSKGHLAPYFTSVSKCTMCGQFEARDSYRADPEKFKERNKRNHFKHHEKRKAGLKRYKKENPEVIKKHNDARDRQQMALATRLWRAMNPEKNKHSQIRGRLRHREKRNQYTERWRLANPERLKTYQKEYRKRNYDRIRNYDSAHYQKARRQMPFWADKAAILEIYNERTARNLSKGGIEFHVDHIIPLTGKFQGREVVSGLHVPNNLRVVGARFNMSKSCSFDPETFEELVEGRFAELL